MRIKRPDTRPNEKERRKLSRQREEEKTIQDLRITKKQKTEKKEREVMPLEQNISNKTKEEKVRDHPCHTHLRTAFALFKEEDEEN